MSEFTFKQIANIHGKTARTVRNWWSQHKEATGQELGEIVKSSRKFTSEECEILASYGVKNQTSLEAEIVDEVVDPQEVTSIVPVDSAAKGLLSFNITSVTLHTRNEDITNLETQADTFDAITRKALKAAGRYLADDIKGGLRLAAAQNRHAIAGLQAQAATEAIKDLQEDEL